MIVNSRPDITIEQAVAAYKAYGGYDQAARALGCSRNVIKRRVAANTITEHHPPPDGHTVKGVSTLYDENGNISAQWVKTTVTDDQRQAALEAAVRALSTEIPRQEPFQPPSKTVAELATLYTITDAHVGMHAWGKETGADFDLTIAENVISGCFRQMIANSPPSRVGIVNQLGDFLHTDGMKAMTPASGHMLDADSRYQKIVEVAVRVLRRLINQALQKHELVHVLMADANHDPVGGVWLRTLFAALYEAEPRITVDTSPSPFNAYLHGQTLLGFHHGHTVKKESLPLIFAAKFPTEWGVSKYRYAHTGHLHHVDEKEHAGMIVIQHPTLAAPDAYAARNGWFSQRTATSITYHKTFGQVGRQTVVPEMLYAA